MNGRGCYSPSRNFRQVILPETPGFGLAGKDFDPESSVQLPQVRAVRKGCLVLSLSSVFRFSVLAAAFLLGLPANAAPGDTIPVSVGARGFGSTGDSTFPATNEQGSVTAFLSNSSNLVLGDNNGVTDIFYISNLGQQIRRLSVTDDGGEANGDSRDPSMDRFGNVNAFSSNASNLVPGDTNNLQDVFIRDLLNQRTRRVSVATGGAQANGVSGFSSVSALGTLVAFESLATNLVAGDTNGMSDIFVRDLVNGTTRRISVDSLGNQGNNHSFAPSISADGRYVAFESLASNFVPNDFGPFDIFVYDLWANTIREVSVNSAGNEANFNSFAPAISGNGGQVAFASRATNLVPGDTNNGSDIFVRDVASGVTSRVSVSSAGTQVIGDSEACSISEDGQRVAFRSYAANLVPGDTNFSPDIYVHTRSSGETRRVSVATGGAQGNSESLNGALSGDGQVVVFDSYAQDLVPGDTNFRYDIFQYGFFDQATKVLSYVTGGVMGNGESYLPSLSSDGRYVAFQSIASNLVPGDTNDREDIFLRDVQLGETRRISVTPTGEQANGNSGEPSFSDNGRYVAFSSDATNLVAPGTTGRQIFVRDLQQNTNRIVSLSSSGAVSSGQCFYPKISADGRFVVFISEAPDLVPNDFNQTTDVFVRDIQLGLTRRVSVGPQGVEGNGFSASGSISADGRYVAFWSSAGNLIEDDRSTFYGIFVHDLQTGQNRRVSNPTNGQPANGVSNSPVISADGRWVAFLSAASNLVPGDTNGVDDIFVVNLQSGSFKRVSISSEGVQANGASFSGMAISADGKFVAYRSSASNLAPGDFGDGEDIFVTDVQLGITRRVSVNSAGDPAAGPSVHPATTPDGKFVAFSSLAENLASGFAGDLEYDIYRHETKPFGTKIRGRIVLTDFFGTPPTANFELTPVGGGPQIAVNNVALASNGDYEFTTAGEGSFNLTAKASTFLRKRFASSLVLNGTLRSGVNFTLINGDCDGDNAITIFDYIELSNAFGSKPGEPTWNQAADLDGDGEVTIFDYIILSGNFDREGDS